MEGSCQMSRYTLGEYCKDRGKLALWPLLLSAPSFPSGLVLGPIPSRAPNGLSLETHTTWWNNFFCVPPRWTGGVADVSEALDPPNQHSEKHVWGTGELQTRTKYLFCCFCSSQHQGTVVLLFFHCLFWHTVNSTSLLMQHHIPLHPTTWNVLHQFTWPYMAQPGSYRGSYRLPGPITPLELGIWCISTPHGCRVVPVAHGNVFYWVSWHRVPACKWSLKQTSAISEQ